MTTQNDEFQFFDTQSPMIHGVAPQTGKFHTYIPIASLVGNNGMGPTLDINLFYSPDVKDWTFANWSLRLSHYLDLVQSNAGYHFATLYLSNGEGWSIRKDGYSEPPSLVINHPKNDDDQTMSVVRKDGTTEVFERHNIRLPANLIEGSCFLLKKVISPSGHSLILNWEDHHSSASYVDWISPRLKSVTDESGTLLKIDYKNHSSDRAITFNVYPDSSQQYSHEFRIEKSGITQSSKSKSANITKYSYLEKRQLDLNTGVPHTTFRLNKIECNSGITETLSYDEDTQKTTRHLTTGKNFYSDISYIYAQANNCKTTTVIDAANKTQTQHYFDVDNQQTKEVYTSGCSTRTIESARAFKDNKLMVTTSTTYQNKDQQSRTQVTSATLDVLGNLTSKTENGVTTEWTYYRGMPKEEDLVKTETFSDTSGPLGPIAWAGDYLNPIGWGFQLFGNAGLTWGTRENHTVTHSRYVTNTGKSTFNLPVSIVCPGDPNYFRVYVESEKVYTVRDGQRVDLQWSFYGYADLPVKGDEVKGPAVKPAIKLTVYNPIGDANGKLTSWQNGTMTVEETQYITDVNSPHHGRMKSSSQRILNDKGGTVPDSTVKTAFDYSLASGQLTTTTTITAGNTPAVTQKLTCQSINGQLLRSTDSLGSMTDYQYDTLGRLTQQTDYATDGTTPNATTLSYVDSPAQGNTVTRTSPVGEQTRESFDPLGRLSKTERLHSDGQTWLTLAKTDYDLQGREASITEYDYRPDGSEFSSRTRNLSYDDQGAVSKVQWVGGATQGFDYDPVTRQQTQWVTYGTRHSASTTVVLDEPGGARRHETISYINNHLTRSHTALYDALGRLIQESSSDAPIRQYAYDAFGRLTRISAAGEVTVNEYPAHTPTAIASVARLESAGQSITLGSRVVDSLGRVTQAIVGERTNSFTYSGANYWGKASNVRIGEFQQAIPITLESTYDPIQNQATETTTGGIARNSNNTTSTVQYSRSLRGMLLSETDAFGNSTAFNYDLQGRMTSSSSATATVNFDYDTVGRLATETLTNKTNDRSMVTRYTYDDKDREIKRKFEAQGFKTLTMTQDYNSAHQISGMALYEDATLLRTETFDYDQGRLATYTCDGPNKPVTCEGLVLDKQAFKYDLAGNIKQCDSTSNGRMFSDMYQYDGKDPTQLVSATRRKLDNTTRNCTYTYDNLGYLSDNNGTQLKYNALGKLGSMQSPNGVHGYSYNNLGQVVGCTGTNYFEQFYYQGDYQYARKGVFQINGQRYNRTCVLLNQSAACVLQQNTQKIDNSPATVSHSFEIKDIKGTVIASHNMLDNRSTFFTYTPFGYRPDDWLHSSWIGFNGQPIDRVSGCYHLGNGVRVYNPENQNFQSPDNFSPFGKGGANNRSYCHNDPVNYSDPSGHAEIVHQYTVVTHAPALHDPLAQAIIGGAAGILLAPFTGGASLGLTAAAVGLAIASAGFGIASAALRESDPKLSEAFGWASLGTGLSSAGAGLGGAKLAARAGLQSGSKYTQNAFAIEYRVARNSLSRAGKSGAGGFTGEVIGISGSEKITGSYELYVGGNDTRTLFIDAHGLPRKGHTIAPLPDTEVIFRSGVGTKSSDKGYNFADLINGETPYRYGRGATGIPDYVLSEFPVSIYITDGRLGANFKADLLTTATHLKADIVRPTDHLRFSDLLNQLHSQGFHYERIVGNFCRGTIPTWTPGFIKPILRTHGLF